MIVNLFRKKILPDLSFVGVDMHSHLLPGLDDGLQEIDTTITFIQELQSLGYEKLICTPHIISDLYPNSPDTILRALHLVRSALKEKNISMQIEAAAEYMVDIELERKINSKSKLLTFGKNFILIEMSYVAPSANIEKVIFDLKMKGLQPVLAHPERYGYYHGDFEMYERFIDMGCILQVNFLSLAGYYGRPIKKVAEKLLKNKMITLIGTDIHHYTHLAGIKELSFTKAFHDLLQNSGIRNKELLS